MRTTTRRTVECAVQITDSGDPEITWNLLVRATATDTGEHADEPPSTEYDIELVAIDEVVVWITEDWGFTLDLFDLDDMRGKSLEAKARDVLDRHRDETIEQIDAEIGRGED